jgi:hypothetical protein
VSFDGRPNLPASFAVHLTLMVKRPIQVSQLELTPIFFCAEPSGSPYATAPRFMRRRESRPVARTTRGGT